MDRTLLSVRVQESSVGNQDSEKPVGDIRFCFPLPVTHRLISFLRYRFFLFAGLLPYALGASVAYGNENTFSLFYFLAGLLGLFFALVGVEIFNEYFDAREGGDRVFSLDETKEPSPTVFGLGITAFVLAFGVALYITYWRGTPIMLFALLGFLAAVFYVGPPLRLSYRGLGEVTIALAYGPCMTIGSYYLQTQRFDIPPLLVSLLPLLLLFSLALVNEIPDYYSDKLIGKRNIVVRLGREKAVAFYQVMILLPFISVIVGLFWKQFPLSFLIILLMLPMAWRSVSVARRYFDSPARFLPAVWGTIILYLSVMSIAIISYLVAA